MIHPHDEVQKILHLIDWCVQQEMAIGKLKRKSMEPRLLDQLNHWQHQFSRLRKEAERYQRKRAINALYPSTDTLELQHYANKLYHRYSGFLQKQILHPSFQFVSFQTEGTSDDNTTTQSAKSLKREESVSDIVSNIPALNPVPIGEHRLPPLPYDYDALEPHIDERTMRIHHDEHHKSYVEGLNTAEREMVKARRSGDFSLIRHWEREAAFHGSGHYLHTIFWHNMSPEGGGRPTGPIAEEINRTYGGFDAFNNHFSQAAEKVEGVGWSILVWSPRAHRTEILQVEKHQLLTQQDQVPLLVLDVWEHAYYLKYTNNRSQYINAWWNVVNWGDVNRRFAQARHLRWQPF